MKKKLKAAVEASDIPQVRSILIDIIEHGAGDTTTIEDVTEAISKTPGIFDADDGKFYASRPEEMTETLIESLREDLDRNFSLEKVRLFTEVESIKAGSPHYFRDREKNLASVADYACDTLSIEEEVEDGRVTAAHVSDTPHECAADAGRNADGRKPAARIVGYAIMAAGAVAAIVGLCVPVKFLLGLGIGVFLLGTAITYMALVRPAVTE